MNSLISNPTGSGFKLHYLPVNKVFYLEVWAKGDEQTGLLVPHEKKSCFDRHHQVNTHLLDLNTQILNVAFHHIEGLVFKMEFIFLKTSREKCSTKVLH